MRYFTWPLAWVSFAWSLTAYAAEFNVDVHSVDAKGVGSSLGAIAVKETGQGLVFTPKLKGLPPGQHGFHVHENPACAPGEKDGKIQAGLAAGGHYDPDQTGKHLGPDGQGHRGDLPMLSVAGDGAATQPVTSRRLTGADVAGRSLIIHADPDNYGDQPGGARIACGVIR